MISYPYLTVSGRYSAKTLFTTLEVSLTYDLIQSEFKKGFLAGGFQRPKLEETETVWRNGVR